MLKNARQESFAQNVAAGLAFGDAYSKAGYKANPDAAAKAGSRLAKTKLVSARIAELKAKQSEKAEITRDSLREYLVEVLITPVGEVNAKHRLAQAWRKSKRGQEVKVPDKLKAAELLCRMCGWLAPQAVQVEAGDKLAHLMARIRKGETDDN